ncbi:MAG: class I SAM-dependent methyltransferase [Gemmatimonadetes bacterium]|nr:class I SAM-dependent methyltransferase [Gemmatimonadota bacterium]
MLHALPSPSKTRLAIRLQPRAERAVKRGHPWVFDHGISSQRQEGRPGDLAVIFDRDNRFLAIGLYDPRSPIRVRVLHHGSPMTIDAEWFAARVRQAHERRANLLGTDTSGFRLIHGENDRMPGLIVDRYGDNLVVKLYSAAWVPHLRSVLEGLIDLISPERIILRLSRAVQKQAGELSGLFDGQLLHGPVLTGPVLFRENGLVFEADLLKGQKTGFFLDQRENRARVGSRSAGRTVLNVFSYTGGFSLYAARGRASAVTSLDLSGPALAAAERNFELNRHIASVAGAAHHLLRGDAFDLLRELGRDRQRFDVVILDPPSFAKSQGEIEGAIRSYQKLTRLGVDVLASGGLLVAASCSSRVSEDAFVDAVIGAAQKAGRPLRVIEQTGHALDHPILIPEAAYLKCIFAEVE